MNDDPMVQLEQLLRDEREAIRTLDGQTVLSFARRKQDLVAAIGGPGGKMDALAAARLRRLVPALRHNGVLLAHARDILRDALAAVGAAPTPARGGWAARPHRRMLSVRG